MKVSEQGAAPKGKPEPRKKNRYLCHACRKDLPFCWTCRCGFQICPACMEENMWGLSCNAVTWICPDCGAMCVF